MTAFIVDVSRHQVERSNPLNLPRAKDAGMNVANVQLDRGKQDDVLPPWALGYVTAARALGMGVSTYRWLDNRLPGDVSAKRAYERMKALGGPDGMAHAVDCEDNATQDILRAYVDTMQGLLGRRIAIYSGAWWMKPRGWRIRDMSPYLWAAPTAGYQVDYPGDASPMWSVSYGGHTALDVMQYAVKPLPLTGDCSLSAIRDPAVWLALTGGRSVSLNPDAHITAEHARFINEVEQLELSDTGDLYPYVRQAGYHGSRADQISLDRPNDYSIRLADDKAGPSDKTAAFDWISESARLHNDHTVMYRYGRRIKAAFDRRDPRLKGWREWLTYLDGQLVGFDFVGWFTRVPDSSHGMHHHLSKLRGYVTDWPSYAGMLSILADEPLSTWQAGQSRYYQYAATPTQPQETEEMYLIEANGADGVGAYAVVMPDGECVVRLKSALTGGTGTANLWSRICRAPADNVTAKVWNDTMELFGVTGYRFNDAAVLQVPASPPA